MCIELKCLGRHLPNAFASRTFSKIYLVLYYFRFSCLILYLKMLLLLLFFCWYYRSVWLQFARLLAPQNHTQFEWALPFRAEGWILQIVVVNCSESSLLCMCALKIWGKLWCCSKDEVVVSIMSLEAFGASAAHSRCTVHFCRYTVSQKKRSPVKFWNNSSKSDPLLIVFNANNSHFNCHLMTHLFAKCDENMKPVRIIRIAVTRALVQRYWIQHISPEDHALIKHLNCL